MVPHSPLVPGSMLLPMFSFISYVIVIEQGKTSGSAVKVADLTSIHQFETTLSGSVTTYEGPATVGS